jgi:hypothetical protein
MSPVPIDEPSDEERQEELPEDYDTPFSLPDQEKPAAQPANIDDAELPDHSGDEDVGRLPDDHPSTDVNIEQEEFYDEGIAGAAEAGEPNAESDVTGYNPDEDSRRTKNSGGNQH